MLRGWGYLADVRANTMCSVSIKTDIIPLPLPLPLSARTTNKFEPNNIRFHEFICRTWEIGEFKYKGVQDRTLKLYPGLAEYVLI